MYRDFDAFCEFLDDELPVFDCEERSAMWRAVCATVDGFREDQAKAIFRRDHAVPTEA